MGTHRELLAPAVSLVCFFGPGLVIVIRCSVSNKGGPLLSVLTASDVQAPVMALPLSPRTQSDRRRRRRVRSKSWTSMSVRKDMLALSSVPFVSRSDLMRLWQTSYIRGGWPTVPYGTSTACCLRFQVRRQRRSSNDKCDGRTGCLPFVLPLFSSFPVQNQMKSAPVHSPERAERSLQDPT